jgi:transposase-like protein
MHNHLAKQFCHNPDCSDHGKIGAGNLTIHHQQRAQPLARCKTCNTVFSMRKGTFFYKLRSPAEKVVQVFSLLVEGNGIRGTERLTGVKDDTIIAWLRKAEQHTRTFNDFMMVNIHLTQLQVDEFWAFVKKNRRG